MERVAPRLTVRLGAVRRNYARLKAQAGSAQTGAAVKANGYGLGVEAITATLWEAGCREFFVAGLGEGITVRTTQPEANVNVFNGAMPGSLDALVEHDLVPLLISAEQLEVWAAHARSIGRRLDAGLHFDTGMGRTGFTPTETKNLISDPGILDGLTIRHVLSHMASADDRTSGQPEEQLARFREIRAAFPMGQASLANSAGVFRSPDFHFDLVRPGISLYGGAPIDGEPNPMEHAVELQAPILQIKDVSAGDKVGYGATYEVADDTCHVVVPVGYADGYLRSASNSGLASIDGHECPIVGRVSMDLTIVDASKVPTASLYLGAPVEILGAQQTVDDVANDIGTIANEILTQLSSRYDVIYTND